MLEHTEPCSQICVKMTVQSWHQSESYNKIIAFIIEEENIYPPKNSESIHPKISPCTETITWAPYERKIYKVLILESLRSTR